MSVGGEGDPRGMGGGAGSAVYLMGALRRNGRDARSFSLYMRPSPRTPTDSARTSRNMKSTSRGLCSCSLTHAQDKSCGLTAEIQARIGHRTRTAESKTVSASSRTCSDSDRYAARTARTKTVRARHGVMAEHSDVSRETKESGSQISNSSFLIPNFVRTVYQLLTTSR